ncbi:hypothetical protein P3T76_004569 [Phytophthora citrophthora]|uniref:WW domain-containing protein n=1 Tax=Phytophthora citrophthora TaxID=4793 RepID=A0AAD9GTU8_9STRA|nr:hypothetical protein P3T76_004569 [Phytophthora citrophthora]
MSTFDSTESQRRVHIIDDLLGAVLVLAALGFALLLELTRRQICAVYQLAFVLCAFCSFFIIGGIVDHHLTDEQLTVALYGSYLSSSLTTSYVYLPILAALGISFAALVQLSLCSCQCCCLVGAASVAHSHCFAARIRANLSLYTTSFIALTGAIGARLNARLRESAINPHGGTVHWTLLRAPYFLAMAHIGSLLFVALKLFLQHADKTPTHLRALESPRSHVPTTSQDLTRPPPAPKKIPTKHSSLAKKTNQARSPTNSSAAVALADAIAARSGRRELQLSASTPPDRIARPNNNDGDVSSLISSDSESDDEVLEPVFKSVAVAAAAAVRSGSPRPSLYSGYSSSPPASPTSSIGSSLSTSPIARARAKMYRNGSGTSEVSWSDYENTIDRLSARDYYSDRPSTASSTSTVSLHGLRRRVNTANNPSMVRRNLPTAQLPQLVESRMEGPSASPWITCVDPVSGSSYYYNQQTGESRWDLA